MFLTCHDQALSISSNSWRKIPATSARTKNKSFFSFWGKGIKSFLVEILVFSKKGVCDLISLQ
jgi:hypothetical protein